MIKERVIRLESTLNALLSPGRWEPDDAQYAKIHYKLPDAVKAGVEDKLDGLRTGRQDILFLNARLIEMGYKLKGGAKNPKEYVPDYLRFQRDSCITQSVWSRYISGVQSRTSQDTLLKLVIGMHLDEQQAKRFLALSGSGFSFNDKRDMIVLAIIMNNYFQLTVQEEVIEMVFDVLAYYSEQLLSIGKPGFRNLYDF